MTFVADLHIHSRFSRATSPSLVPEALSLWAQKKGIALVGTGDFTHPGWVSELREKLTESEHGLYKLREDLRARVEGMLPSSCSAPTRFLLTGEISCIYKRGGKTRKVHNLVLMPDFETVEKFNHRLARIGNIKSDGRPILGLDSRDLLEITLESSDRAFFIPAHIWTPWFSLFGTKSGFDTVEECFADLTPHIHALETGLSSDPPMNRLLSALDPYLLVSHSDAHSPEKLGREADLFDVPFDYDRICAAMTDGRGFEGTVEFYPEEGKYHYDGHRKCDVCLHPVDALECGGICPVCGKPLTLGVLHRITELADRSTPMLSKPFHSLIPLPEILSEILRCGPATKKVRAAYDDLLSSLGPELNILMDVNREEVEKFGGGLLAEALDRMRRGHVIRQKGYDGEYGMIRLFEPGEMDELSGQGELFQMVRATERNRTLSIGKRLHAGKIKERQTSAPTKTADPLLDPLNPAQREAVVYEGGHLRIIAGPGTGKTMTLTRRIAWLIRSSRAMPEQVLALTFTHKAAREVHERIVALVPGTSGRGMLVTTFHGFCLEVLRHEGSRSGLPPDFVLCSEPDAQALARRACIRAGKSAKKAAALLRNLSSLKAFRLDDRPPDSSFEGLIPLFEIYQKELRSLGMLDFDDLETETLRLFREHPDATAEWARHYPWIFVDEYQDTSPVQASLLKALVNFGPTSSNEGVCSSNVKSPILFAIGDPNQAIYGFRGADVRGFHNFSQDFPGAEEIMLTRNYRSPQVILDAAAGLMDGQAPLEGEFTGGAPVAVCPCRSAAEEAEMCVEQVEKLMGGTTHFSLDSGRVASYEEGENLSFGDIAVLFRLNAEGDAFEDAFSRAGIPYIRSGEKPLISRHPACLLWRFLQVLQNPENSHYRKVYAEVLNEFNVVPPKMDLREMIGEGGMPALGSDLPGLIEQASALHGFKDLGEEEAVVLRRVKEMAEEFEGDLSSFLDLLSLDRAVDHQSLLGDRVALMSLHAAKGLEWSVVFIAGCEDRLLPCNLFGDTNEAEERRLFYVGMTRTRSRLILSHATRRTIEGRAVDMMPSPFLDLIPAKCCIALERGTWKPKKKPPKQLDLF
ncbi:MAG: UvrD-helicase domain-containing protein [Desulfatiglandaceae bacterium]